MPAEKPFPIQHYVYGLSALLFLGAIVSYFAVPAFQAEVQQAYEVLSSGDKPRITEYVRHFGFWGPVVVILLMTLQMFLIVVPSWLLMIIAILAYGGWWGGLLSVTAVTIASTVGYGVGKALSRAALTNLVGRRTEAKLENTVNEYGTGAIVLFRLAPFLSNDAISFVAGMLKMGYWRFILATLAGIVPLTVLLAFFSRDIQQLKSILMWVGGGGLALYLIYLAVQYFRSK
ncbi:TVP38/TMEM64 family protein [Neolewinella litorea]|uniref:TVP38/TMEM64 family membrane protein n=1 Tax=Neolewinella litorea TaxID=2562452 RepID=A0A4S4N8N7_9BACT|nr:VTT domain-containing protein [Neolewinella litorea]THH35572.1 TVP38/TMEM64 family protein [Neolewinella litorea]